MGITISGVNNNDKILASDGVIDQLSGFSVVGVMTASSFSGNLIGDVTGNLTGNVNASSNLLLQIGGSEKFRVGSSGQLGIGGANYGTSGQVLQSAGSGAPPTWNTISTPDADKIIEGNTKVEVVDSGTGYITAEVDGTEALRIKENGYFGLGTNSPVQDLHIRRDNAALRIETPSGSTLQISSGGAGAFFGTISNHNLAFMISNSEKMSLTTAGHLIPGNDSQHDLGLTGTRWRNLYADTLYGDGSNLTGISGVTINNNANNRIITGSGTANTLEAETTLEWNGTNTLTSVNQGSGYPDFIFSIKTVAGGGESERFRVGNGPFRIGNTNYSANSYANILVVGSDYNDRGITIVSGNSNEGNIFFGDGGDNDIGKIQYAHSDNSMRFTTNTGERLRIQSDGRVLIGTTTPSGYSNRLLTVAAADGDSSIELRTATDHAGQISFTDGSAGDVTNYRGYIQYNHQGDYMAFGTLSTERARITSSGRFGLGTSSPDHIFEVEDNNSSIAVSRSGANAQLLFKSNSVGQAGQIQVSESSGGGVMLFSTKTTGGTLTERFRIATSGEIGLSGGNYGSSGQVLTSQGSGSAPVWAAASGGKVVNYDSTTVTAAGSASISQGNYSNNIIGLSYAASSSSNKLLLIAMVSFGYQHGQSVASRFTISNNPITGSTGDASGSRRRATTAGYMDSMYQVSNMTLVYEHSSPSTSAVTYGVQLGQSDNGTQTVYWNRSMNDSNHNYRIRAATTLTIIELEG